MIEILFYTADRGRIHTVWIIVYIPVIDEALLCQTNFRIYFKHSDTFLPYFS